MKSTLTEELSRVKSLMGLTESLYFRRRVPPQELSSTLDGSLNYATKMWKKSRTVSFEQFMSTVVAMTIDEFGPKLLGDNEEFPYDEIFHYISNTFYDKIKDTYQQEFGEVAD